MSMNNPESQEEADYYASGEAEAMADADFENNRQKALEEIRKKNIQELKDIRVRLTQIYLELGNPKDCPADMMLKEDIEKFEKDVS